MERWPGLVIAPGTPVLVQESGGVCMAERTVRAQARLAVEAGAAVREETAVAAIHPGGAAVEVTTTAGETYRAAVAVVTAGPWAGPLLRTAGFDLPLVPSFEQVTYWPVGRRPAAVPDDHRLDRRSTLSLPSDGDGTTNAPYALPNP